MTGLLYNNNKVLINKHKILTHIFLIKSLFSTLYPLQLIENHLKQFDVGLFHIIICNKTIYYMIR